MRTHQPRYHYDDVGFWLVAAAFVVLIAIALAGCAGGDPLPVPSGPWEPLNGWNPDAPMVATQSAGK